MQDRIGEVFDGTVSGVTAFGAFVTLDQVYVEGLVHISELGSDYFHHDPIRHCLIGERTKQQYRVGDRLRVKLVRADLESNRIDFVPATATDEAVQAEAGAGAKIAGERDALALARSRKTGRPLAVERHLLEVELTKAQEAPRKKPVVSGHVGTPAGKSRVLGRQKPSGHRSQADRKTGFSAKTGSKAKPTKSVKSVDTTKAPAKASAKAKTKTTANPVAKQKAKARNTNNRTRRAKA